MAWIYTRSTIYNLSVPNLLALSSTGKSTKNHIFFPLQRDIRILRYILKKKKKKKVVIDYILKVFFFFLFKIIGCVDSLGTFQRLYILVLYLYLFSNKQKDDIQLYSYMNSKSNYNMKCNYCLYICSRS